MHIAIEAQRLRAVYEQHIYTRRRTTQYIEQQDIDETDKSINCPGQLHLNSRYLKRIFFFRQSPRP